MAKYSTYWSSISMVAQANGALTAANGYVAVRGGGTAMQIKLSEVYLGGEAASTSAPSIIILDRSSTVSVGALSFTAGGTSLTDATATAPATLPAGGQSAVTTQPSRSSATQVLHLSFNAYGGIVRWVASPDQAITIYGSTTASVSELNLSAFTGSTTATNSGHFLYEVV
jgi:hypothetical protein